MPVTAIEAHQSRKIGLDFREYVYVVTGTDDEAAAMNAVAAMRDQYIAVPNPNRRASADTATITLRQRMTASQEIDGQNVDNHTWLATMRYEPDSEPNDDGDDVLNYAIAITANTASVKAALEQTKKLASGEADPGDFGNWIGVVRNGAGFDVQGVDAEFFDSRLSAFDFRPSEPQTASSVNGVVRNGSAKSRQPNAGGSHAERIISLCGSVKRCRSDRTTDASG